MSTTVKNSKMARRYGEDFKRQAVELMIHGGKTQRQVARELDVSEYNLNLWKKAWSGPESSDREQLHLRRENEGTQEQIREKI
jgi:transposase-like protein